MKQTYICRWCDGKFLAERQAKTCSDSCRQNLHRYGCICGGAFLPHKQVKTGKTYYLVRKCSDCPRMMAGKKADME